MKRKHLLPVALFMAPAVAAIVVDAVSMAAFVAYDNAGCLPAILLVNVLAIVASVVAFILVADTLAATLASGKLFRPQIGKIVNGERSYAGLPQPPAQLCITDVQAKMKAAEFIRSSPDLRGKVGILPGYSVYSLDEIVPLLDSIDK